MLSHHPIGERSLSYLRRRLWLGVFVALMGCAATPTRGPQAAPADEVARREILVDALTQELSRSVERLKLDDYEAPYFLSYQLKDENRFSIAGRYGALTSQTQNSRRYVYVESRVGSYDFDNFANIDAESYRLSDFRADRLTTIDDDPKALRGTLWLLTDEAYKKALSDYLTKRGGAVFATADKTAVPSFSREQPVTYRGEVKRLEFDEARFASLVREITAMMRDAPFLLDSQMEVTGQRTIRYLVNSEGATIVDEHTIYSIHIQAHTRADDGMLLENGRMIYARDARYLPDDETIRRETRKMLAELEALRTAEVINPYHGPAILDAEAAGVLFHEAVGHRLEGERQMDEQEGRTFKGRVGMAVIPTFLSVYDDPTLDQWQGTQLNGYYRHDDEGVVAQRAALVEAGKLKGFLMSRTPIEGVFQSNGHGRAQGVLKPRARMSNLLIEADPEQAVPYEKLKEMLIDEVRRQGKPFGLVIRDITGGSTNTLGYGYQAFKGIPRMIYKVDPDTGEETLVRGVELVGTPLSSINKIIAASQETGIFNGYCGAESGYVPVSTVAPALLTTEIELQRSTQARERAPVLPAPWSD
jgi:TldD protein